MWYFGSIGKYITDKNRFKKIYSENIVKFVLISTAGINYLMTGSKQNVNNIFT